MTISPNIKTEDEARKAIFQLANIIIYMFIKNTSNFVGAEKLDAIYNEIEGNSATKMVNISIMLDYYKEFPLKSLKDMFNDCENNPLERSCLRLLTHQRLYTRPVEDFSKRQQICDIADLDHGKQIYFKKSEPA